MLSPNQFSIGSLRAQGKCKGRSLHGWTCVDKLLGQVTLEGWQVVAAFKGVKNEN